MIYVYAIIFAALLTYFAGLLIEGEFSPANWKGLTRPVAAFGIFTMVLLFVAHLISTVGSYLNI